MKNFEDMDLLKDYTTEQKIKKKFRGEPFRTILRNPAQVPEPTITVPTVSNPNHLGFLKDEQQKLRQGRGSRYEQALRYFYTGIERTNTHVD